MKMTVVPGAAGQAFMHSVVPKMLELQKLLKKLKLKREIEADGGVNAETASIAARAGGATVLVAGAAVFGAFDARTAITQLRKAAA